MAYPPRATVALAAETPTKPGLLLVVNKGDRTLGIYDPNTGKPIHTVALEEVTGHEVGADPNGKLAFVPIFGNSGVGSPGTDGRLIRVIDVAQGKTVHTIDLGKGLRPHEAIFGPKNGLLYVTTEIANAVTVIDPKLFKVLYTIPTGQEHSHMLAISSDGRRGFTANVGPGTVSVLDLEEKKLLEVIPIGGPAQRISLSKDDKYAFTSDQRRPRLAVVSTSENKVAKYVELPGTGYGTAPTEDGKHLLVAIPGARKVAIVDLEKWAVTRTIDVPAAPQEILVRPGGGEAFVSCDSSGKVAVLDLNNWTMARVIDAGAGADGLAWAAGSGRPTVAGSP
jgi:YVTN family beta-propeller protein